MTKQGYIDGFISKEDLNVKQLNFHQNTTETDEFLPYKDNFNQITSMT